MSSQLSLQNEWRLFEGFKYRRLRVTCQRLVIEGSIELEGLEGERSELRI